MWPKRLPFFLFCVFLYLIVIILIEENKKKLTLCQNNEIFTKNLLLLMFRDNKTKMKIFVRIYV